MMTDPIAEFLTQLRNAGHARRSEVTVCYSKIREAMGHILLKKRFIESCERIEKENVPFLHIVLRTDRDPLELRRVSKPGQRIYQGYKEIRRVRNGLGIGLISTSTGILTDDEARSKKIGGEYICEIY